VGRLKYLIIAFIFIGAGGLLFYFHFNKEKVEPAPQTYWKYRVKYKKPMSPFICEADTFYSFKASRGEHGGTLHGIRINGRYFDLINKGVNGLKYIIKFNKPTKIQIYNDLQGIWFRDGEIEIWEEKKNFPRLYFLTPDCWSDFSLQVKRGQKLNFNWGGYPMLLIGYFKGDKLVKDKPIKRNYYTQTIYSWDNYTLKFKAAEIPYFCEFNKNLWVENHPFKLQGRNVGNALYLEKGDTGKFPMWVDKHHSVYFGGVRGSVMNSFDVRVGGVRVKRIGGDGTALRSGYITYRVKKRVILSSVSASRGFGWSFRLKRNQTKKIKVDKGDVLVSNGGGRYYVNNVLFEGRRKNYHNAFKNGYFIFKGSFDSGLINVKYSKRRGY